jgi:hypothetical protein
MLRALRFTLRLFVPRTCRIGGLRKGELRHLIVLQLRRALEGAVRERLKTLKR